MKTTGSGDDYAAMYEVLARRFRRGRAGAAARVKALEVGEEARRAAPVPSEALVVREPGGEGEEELSPIPPSVEEAYGAVHLDHDPEADAQAAPVAAAEDASAAKEGDGAWDLPDLFVVDGGRGQLAVALQAARDLGLHQLSIVGLAKERENAAGEKTVDRVYLPGQKNGIRLTPGSSALFFLARARDEAHRFANYARKRLGKARVLRSELDDVPGIGPVARKALLRELGSMAAVRRASDAEILAVPGITRRHLSALRRVIPSPGEA